jgi:hypothetical protein
MTTAAVQASKKAFIVFHLAGSAECEDNMMPGYAWYKDADRHDSSSLTGPSAFFATRKHAYNPISPTETQDVSGAPTNACWRGRKDMPSKLPRVKQVTRVISHRV